jgi:hypothetical protein
MKGIASLLIRGRLRSCKFVGVGVGPFFDATGSAQSAPAKAEPVATV